MGYIVNINCPKCSLNKQLNLGHGMSDYSIEHIILNLSKSDAFVVGQMQKEGQIKSFEFNRFLSVCPTCKRIEATPVLDITLNSGNKIQFGLNCVDCKEKLLILRDVNAATEIECPICDDGKLEVQPVGRWD